MPGGVPGLSDPVLQTDLGHRIGLRHPFLHRGELLFNGPVIAAAVRCKNLQSSGRGGC